MSHPPHDSSAFLCVSFLPLTYCVYTLCVSYPWHKHGAYKQLTDEEDERMLHWVLEFNKCDLYSKDAQLVDVEAVKPYYLSLIAKYMPATLKW